MSKVLVALCGLAVAGAAHAQVIDFQSLEQNNAGVNDAGPVYMEDGYTVSKGPGEPFDFASFGTQEGRYPGSTALFNNTVNGLIILTEDNGRPFDVFSIDLALLNGAGSVTVNFTGFFPGGGSLGHQVVVNDPSMPLNLFTFALPFRGIERLEWRQESPFHQFDNINLVPAPTAAALLGLGGLAAFRRRR